MIKIIMERITSLDNPKLDGIIEHDELYVKSGMKGRNYHDGIIEERMPGRRGLRPPPGRGTFERPANDTVLPSKRRQNGF